MISLFQFQDQENLIDFNLTLEAGNVELSQEEVKTIDDKLNTMEFKVFGGH